MPGMPKPDTPAENPARILARDGGGALPTAHLVAVLMATGGIPGRRDLSRAAELVTRFDHPSRIDRAAFADLVSTAGVGRPAALRLKAALELGRRTLLPRASTPRMSSSREAADYFMPRLAGLEVEQFRCAMLDTRNRLIREVTVATGTVNACFIHPREVFRPAITESSCAVILVHNHPSGDLRPSEEDVALTRRVVEAGTLLGIRVLDHLIVGLGNYFSFLDAGLLSG